MVSIFQLLKSMTNEFGWAGQIFNTDTNVHIAKKGVTSVTMFILRHLRCNTIRNKRN